MPLPRAFIHFLDPRIDPPARVDVDPRTVLAIPHNRDRVVTISAADVLASPRDYICWAEIPQPVEGIFRRRSL